MRTTLNLNTTLLREAKQRAAERGTTLTRILEEALARLLRGGARPGKGYRYRPLVVKGRTAPAINIADRNALYERMEETS